MTTGKTKGKKIKALTRTKSAMRKRKVESEQDRERRYTDIVIDLMKQGMSVNYIKSYLLEDTGLNLNLPEISKYVIEAGSILSHEYLSSTSSIKAVHVKRYNKTILELLATEELDQKDIAEEKITWEQWAMARNKKIAAFSLALDTMLQKEKCLQMHSSTFEIQISEEININVQPQQRPKINIKNLKLSEQIELLKLIQNTKKVEQEPMSVIAAKAVESNTVDTIAEVIDTKVNIDEISHTIPDVQKTRGELANDPVAKLRAALAKMAEAKLTKDNPNTGIKVIEQQEIN